MYNYLPYGEWLVDSFLAVCIACAGIGFLAYTMVDGFLPIEIAVVLVAAVLSGACWGCWLGCDEMDENRRPVGFDDIICGGYHGERALIGKHSSKE